MPGKFHLRAVIASWSWLPRDSCPIYTSLTWSCDSYSPLTTCIPQELFPKRKELIIAFGRLWSHRTFPKERKSGGNLEEWKVRWFYSPHHTWQRNRSSLKTGRLHNNLYLSFFKLLGLNEMLLIPNQSRFQSRINSASEWIVSSSYSTATNIINALQVTNDCAECGVTRMYKHVLKYIQLFDYRNYFDNFLTIH